MNREQLMRYSPAIVVLGAALSACSSGVGDTFGSGGASASGFAGTMNGGGRSGFAGATGSSGSSGSTGDSGTTGSGGSPGDGGTTGAGADPGASGSAGSSGTAGTGGSQGTGGGPDRDAGQPGDAATGGAAGGRGGQAGSDANGGGTAAPSFTTMWSGTVVATPSQQLMSASGVNTYRTYVRTRASGKFNWAFWVSNGVDSTYGGGQAMPNKIGGTWKIEAAYVADGGSSPAGNVVTGSQVPVTFGGSPNRSVRPGDKFWSDPVSIELPADHDLAFTWALSGTGYPFVSASFITTYRASGRNLANQEAATGFTTVNDPMVAPELFAYDRPVTNRLCFLGDSITQGVGSGRNTYGYWVAKIGAGLSPDIGVWNLGSGWARAADASSDGYWLYKAKQCTEVAVILGVNDLQSSARTPAQILGDLTTIINKLKQNNPATKIILFTVPTFNLTGSALNNWRTINGTIRTKPPAGVDRVFDIAAVQSQPAPNDGMVKSSRNT